jgi:RHS repeat-associated protein
MLVNSSQAIVAKYLYDAFGNILSKSGLLADANLYRFSSKEAHPNSGLVYYLYRYYDPNLQRWPNRDPLGEYGFEATRHTATRNVASVRLSVGAEPITGPNLYGFIGNNPIDGNDPDGLKPFGQAACDAAQRALAAAFRTLANAGPGAVAAAMPMLNQLIGLMNFLCNSPPPPPPVCPVTNPNPTGNPPVLPPIIWIPTTEECIEGLCVLGL